MERSSAVGSTVDSTVGSLSDKYGRKKILAICALGSAIGYILSGAAITMGSLSILIIGRMIDGATTGNQPIAQAAIIDTAPEDKKAFYIALVLLAMSIGYIVGVFFIN